MDNATLKELVKGAARSETDHAQHGPKGEANQNACSESFNVRLRDELLNTECCGTLAEAKVPGSEYRRSHNEHRPRSALDCSTPRSSRGVDESEFPIQDSP